MKITEADCLLNCLSIAIVEGRVIFPVQGEIENLALWTGQNRETIYFETIWIDRAMGVGILWSEELGAWEFTNPLTSEK